MSLELETFRKHSRGWFSPGPKGDCVSTTTVSECAHCSSSLCEGCSKARPGLLQSSKSWNSSGLCKYKLLLVNSPGGGQSLIFAHFGSSQVLILISARESSLPRTKCELDMTRDHCRETWSKWKINNKTKIDFSKNEMWFDRLTLLSLHLKLNYFLIIIRKKCILNFLFNCRSYLC